MQSTKTHDLTPRLTILSESQIERLYDATLACLDRTGVEVRSVEACRLLTNAGARVDGVRVHIPAGLIEEALAACPQSFTIFGRDGQNQIEVAPGRVYFGPGPTCTHFIDPETGKRRRARRGDPALVARVCDRLDNIDYVMGLGLISDVAAPLAPVYEFAELLCNTGKPLLQWAYSVDNVSDIYEIAAAACGSREAFRAEPNFALFSTIQAPLVHTEADLANVLWAIDHGIPVVYLGGGSAGLTAPVTGAGVLLVALAGVLSGLAIIQLKRPGAPVCLGGVLQPMALRTCRPSYGGPELSLYSAAFVEVLHHLGLPAMGTAGASEAKTVDLQAAVESTVQVILSALSGTAMVHDVGFLDCADLGSLDMLVLNDEIISLAHRILRGIEVTEDTLMATLIDQVGPGGSFVSEMETARQCRTEIWNSPVFDRQIWENWLESGARTMSDRIKARTRRILSEWTPPSPSDGLLETISDVLRAAELRHEDRK
jgi:trimethylamine--corrinoid protein Co-methyltransferase